MNDNEIPSAGGMPNPNPEQPVEQPVVPPVEPPVAQPTPQPIAAQPVEQPSAQPPAQPVAQPVMSEPAAGALNTSTPNAKKKTGLVVGLIVGILAVAGIVAALLIFLPKGGGEKVVSCATNTTTMGISIDTEANVRVKDGEITDGDMVVSVDLKSLRDSYRAQEQTLVDSLTSSYEKLCTDHCTLDYDYTKGDSVRYTLQYDGDGVDAIVYSYGTEKLSAQEIADKIQDALESSGYTCTQR
ncbi:hypothetical protein IKF73_02470 [Candidatus Saccharibacteria bacterium]|nr:hypothetical protein [Candidatus Saccharibacteria bacterium]